jgi:hypothetical protein
MCDFTTSSPSPTITSEADQHFEGANLDPKLISSPVDTTAYISNDTNNHNNESAKTLEKRSSDSSMSPRPTSTSCLRAQSSIGFQNSPKLIRPPLLIVVVISILVLSSRKRPYEPDDNTDDEQFCHANVSTIETLPQGFTKSTDASCQSGQKSPSYHSHYFHYPRSPSRSEFPTR